MTVVPSELGLTNTLSPSSPLYCVTRECSSSSLSPSAQQGMERPINTRLKKSTYSNANNEELSYFERKRKMAAIHQRQKSTNGAVHHQMPERLQSLVSGHEHLGNPEVMAKWVASFLPKPEPPRFFRPLCARLARQQQRLREEQAACTRRCEARMDEVRTRLAMSVSEVRAEQKAMLRELRQQRKRGGEQKKGEEKGGREEKKRGESGGREKQRKETEGGEQRNNALRSSKSESDFMCLLLT